MWKYYALLSAVFASLTALFSKMGVKDIEFPESGDGFAGELYSRAGVGNCLHIRGCVPEIRDIAPRTLLFLFLSAVATGLSWLFYFKALQLGDVSKVAPSRQAQRASHHTAFDSAARGKP